MNHKITQYLIKNKIALFITLVLSFFLLYSLLEIIGRYQFSGGDNYRQHLLFFDYIRQNFFLYGDLTPQFFSTYGMGISSVALIYYGLYSPFMFISFSL